MSGTIITTTGLTAEEKELKQYRFRRWMFVLGITVLAMIAAFLLAWLKQGSVVEHAVDGFVGIAETIIVTYLGASVIDRSSILNNMGERIKSGPIGAVLNSTTQSAQTTTTTTANVVP